MKGQDAAVGRSEGGLDQSTFARSRLHWQ